MGGGCVCNNYIKKYILNSSEEQDNIIPLENGQNIIQNKGYNKITSKTSNILYNIMESNKESKAFNKRYSDYHNMEKKQLEKNSNLKNITNKISNIEGRNTSFNENSFLGLKNTNNNDENIKKMASINNSSYYNGSNIYPVNSKLKGNENIEEENINANNKSNFDNPNNKHNVVMKKIKKKDESYRRSDTNINCNLGEHNFIFINISRGSSFMHNNNYGEKFESTTPKMILEKDNLDDEAKGNKNLFSHFCKNRMGDKASKNQYNYNNPLIVSEFMPTFDMNKYSEEMLNTINSIRTNPGLFIKHIDYLIDNNINRTEEGVFLISHEVDEKIKLTDNYIEMFNKAKEMLKEKMNSPKDLSKLSKIIYRDDLEIILDETNYNENYNNSENESEEEEDEQDNDIKNIPSKLNHIYDDDIFIIDDEIEGNDDKTKLNGNLNIIDFDNEENIQTGENENDKKYNSSIIINNNDNSNNVKNYKIIINNKDIGDSYTKKKKFKKKRPKVKKKHNINSILDLNDDKIANLILQKRKEIKRQYPQNIFKMSVIKDIKISILIQLIAEEFFKENNKNKLKDIIFNSHFKYFAVSWTNEINRNFISISCFA